MKDIGEQLPFMTLYDLEVLLEQKEYEECKKENEEYFKNKYKEGE